MWIKYLDIPLINVPGYFQSSTAVIFFQKEQANMDIGPSEIWPKYVKANQIQDFHRKSLTNFNEIENFY